jgi:hypothetical protein
MGHVWVRYSEALAKHMTTADALDYALHEEETRMAEEQRRARERERRPAAGNEKKLKEKGIVVDAGVSKAAARTRNETKEQSGSGSMDMDMDESVDEKESVEFPKPKHACARITLMSISAAPSMVEILSHQQLF